MLSGVFVSSAIQSGLYVFRQRHLAAHLMGYSRLDLSNDMLIGSLPGFAIGSKTDLEIDLKIDLVMESMVDLMTDSEIEMRPMDSDAQRSENCALEPLPPLAWSQYTSLVTIVILVRSNQKYADAFCLGFPEQLCSRRRLENLVYERRTFRVLCLEIHDFLDPAWVSYCAPERNLLLNGYCHPTIQHNKEE